MKTKLKLLPVSILLPVFNEEDVIEDVVKEWNQKVLKKIKGSDKVELIPKINFPCLAPYLFIITQPVTFQTNLMERRL